MEKMLVAEALDERDFLRKKIQEKIADLDVVTVVKTSDKTTDNGVEISKYNDDAKAAVQSIKDMITRYKAINLAIAKSNATETVTVDGQTMTRAEAITLRKDHTMGAELEENLNKQLIRQLEAAQTSFVRAKRNYDTLKDKYTQTMLSSEKEDKLSEEKINGIDALTKGEIPVLLDPVNVAGKVDDFKEKQERFYKDLETAIKVSNASTTIEI